MQLIEETRCSWEDLAEAVNTTVMMAEGVERVREPHARWKLPTVSQSGSHTGDQSLRSSSPTPPRSHQRSSGIRISGRTLWQNSHETTQASAVYDLYRHHQPVSTSFPWQPVEPALQHEDTSLCVCPLPFVSSIGPQMQR